MSEVTLKELKSETTNEGGSNCPQDKVTDTNTSDIEYNNPIIYKDCTIRTPTNRTSIPTHRSIKEGTYDIISDFEGNTMRKINAEALYLRSVAL